MTSINLHPCYTLLVRPHTCREYGSPMSEVSVQAITDIVLLKPWLGAAPVSVLLQVVALIRLKGALHSLMVMLTVITGAVFGVAGAAFYMTPGNMWQILLIMGTPPLLVVTVGLYCA